MDEANARLLCPECTKAWEESPAALPNHDEMFHCPNCHATRRLAEFARTDRDLNTLKTLS